MAYTTAEIVQAQVRLKEMELLLLNYAQQAALASVEGDAQADAVTSAQARASRVFIEAMSASIAELKGLLGGIQNQATGVERSDASSSGTA